MVWTPVEADNGHWLVIWSVVTRWGQLQAEAAGIVSLWCAGSHYVQKKKSTFSFHSLTSYPYLTVTAAEWSCQYFVQRSLGVINASAPARDRLQQADLRTDPLCSVHPDERTPLGVSFNWPLPSCSNCIYLYNTDSCTQTHTQIPSDAHMHMLATDYPWTYLLEDIPASQSFTANQRDRRTKWISELKRWVCL